MMLVVGIRYSLALNGEKKTSLHKHTVTTASPAYTNFFLWALTREGTRIKLFNSKSAKLDI